MARKDKNFKRIRKVKAIDPRKEGLLADLDQLVLSGVKITDCGEKGLLIENYVEGMDLEKGPYITDEDGRWDKTRRVYIKTRGYELCSDDKDFYLRLIKEL